MKPNKVKVVMFDHDGSLIGEYQALKYDWYYDVDTGAEHYSFAVSNGAQIGVIKRGKTVGEVKERTR